MDRIDVAFDMIEFYNFYDKKCHNSPQGND